MEESHTYKKVVVRENGSPEVLKLEESKLVPHEKNGLLIEVWAIGIGFADIMAQRGGYVLAPKKPFTPGYDFLGRILKANGSSTFNEGDMVCALLPVMGTYSEIIEVEEKYLVKVPNGINLTKVAASLLNYLTAYYILDSKAKVKANDHVFIQGASGGVGLALAQIGKLKMLKMTGTSSKSKFDLLQELGVEPIDYNTNDFETYLKENYPERLDAAFDARGGDYLKKSASILKRGGTVVSYGFSGNGFGGNKEMYKGLWEILRIILIPNGKKVKLCGTPGEIKKNPTKYRSFLELILNQIKDGKLDPPVDSVFEFDEVVKAHQKFEAGSLKGKIVIKTKYFQQN